MRPLGFDPLDRRSDLLHLFGVVSERFADFVEDVTAALERAQEMMLGDPRPVEPVRRRASSIE